LLGTESTELACSRFCLAKSEDLQAILNNVVALSTTKRFQVVYIKRITFIKASIVPQVNYEKQKRASLASP